MKAPANSQCHSCCPKDWRSTPDITGSFELDAGIARNSNADLPARIRLYCKTSEGYGPRTAYNGYDAYSGDE